MFQRQVPPSNVSVYSSDVRVTESHTKARACLIQDSLVASLAHLMKEVDSTESGANDQDIDAKTDRSNMPS